MKKRRTMLFCTLASIGLLTSCVFGQTTTKSSEAQLNDIQKIYKLYQDNGGTLSYEEWLFSIRGPKGDTGEKGADGTSVLTGEGAPASDKGKNGDSYIDLNTWDYYTKEESGWTLKGNLRGPQGEKGETGAQGEKGDTGDQGPQGEKGDTGDQGPQGEKGDTGAQGETGPQGPQGEKGDTGPQGEKGDKGDKGDTGAQGEKGDTGAQGEKGDTGKSAYQLYKDAHPDYTGTEEQWLDDLVNGRLGTEEPTYYTVTFDLGYDGLSFTQQVEEGQKVKKPETPQRNGYNFIDWVDSNQDHWVFNGFTITEDITLYAVWSNPIQYFVRFENNDGKLLASDLGYWGETAEYSGTTPIAANQDPHYYYTFAGWDKSLVIEDDMTVTAVYDATYIATTAYYYDFDGTTLLATVPLGEGEEPHYDGETPTRVPDTVNQLQYQFAGWKKTAETSDSITFVAEYESCTNGLDIEGNTVAYYHGVSTNVVIPSSWNGYAITSIQNRAFDCNKTIISVSIPDTVNFIGSYAFRGCSSLISVQIPEGVTALYDYTFDSCTSLTTIVIPEGVTSINNSAFGACSSLESVVLPNTITSIGMNAFWNCTALKSINIPDSVTEIFYGAFYSCYSLKRIVLPNSVVTIHGSPFSSDYDLLICCEAEYKPHNWDGQWYGNATVAWGYIEDFNEGGITYAVFEIDGNRYANAIDFDEELTVVTVPAQIHNIPVTGVLQNAIWSARTHLRSFTTPEGMAFVNNSYSTNIFQNVIYPTDNSLTGTVGGDGNLWGIFTAPEDGVITVEETVLTASDGCIAVYELGAPAFTTSPSTNYIAFADTGATVNGGGKLTAIPVEKDQTYVIKAGAFSDRDRQPDDTYSSNAGNTETIEFSYTAYTRETFTGEEGDLVKSSLSGTYVSATLNGENFTATPNRDQSVYTISTSEFDSAELKFVVNTKTYTLGECTYEITNEAEEIPFFTDKPETINFSPVLVHPTDTSFTGAVGDDGNLWGVFTAPEDGAINVEETISTSNDGYIAVYESTAAAFTSDYALAKSDSGASANSFYGKLTAVQVTKGHTYVIKGGSYYDRNKVPGGTPVSNNAGNTETISFSYAGYYYSTFNGEEGGLVKKFWGEKYDGATLNGEAFTATPNEDRSIYTLESIAFDSTEMKVTTTTKTYILGEDTYAVESQSIEVNLLADSWTGTNTGTYTTLDNGSVLIAFTPTEDGQYTFTLDGVTGTDVKFGLYAANFSETGFAGDPLTFTDQGKTDAGETFTYHCTAGTTYYIKATYHYNEWVRDIVYMTSLRGGKELTISVA